MSFLKIKEKTFEVLFIGSLCFSPRAGNPLSLLKKNQPALLTRNRSFRPTESVKINITGAKQW